MKFAVEVFQVKKSTQVVFTIECGATPDELMQAIQDIVLSKLLAGRAEVAS